MSEDIKGCVGERGKVTETEMPGTGLDFRYGRNLLRIVWATV